MKKFFVLMSLGSILLGGYSFSFAMSCDDDQMLIEPIFADINFEDEGRSEGTRDSFVVLDEVLSSLSNNHENEQYLAELEECLRDVRNKRSDQIVVDVAELEREHEVRSELSCEIVKYGKTHSVGEFVPDAVRKIEDVRQKVSESFISDVSKEMGEYDSRIKNIRKEVADSLKDQSYSDVDMREFNSMVRGSQKKQQALMLEREQSWFEKNPYNYEYFKNSINYNDCNQELLNKQRELAKKEKVILSTMQHVDTEGMTDEMRKDLLVKSLLEGKLFKASMLKEIKQGVGMHQARIMNLLYAPCLTLDKQFKFSSIQKDLRSNFFFSGPENLEAGKFDAFYSGNILALISYLVFLDQLFSSDYLFDRECWTDVLKSILMIFVRVSQDVHAVATVDAFIDTLIKDGYPVDSRLAAWKAVSRGGYFSWSDLDYCEQTQGTIISYLLSIWMPRIKMAANAGFLPNCAIVFDWVSERILSIDSEVMPSPALVCCLGKFGDAWDASVELEQVFRMFDFSVVRKEGAEVAIGQLNSAFGDDFVNDWVRIFNRISVNPV